MVSADCLSLRWGSRGLPVVGKQFTAPGDGARWDARGHVAVPGILSFAALLGFALADVVHLAAAPGVDIYSQAPAVWSRPLERSLFFVRSCDEAGRQKCRMRHESGQALYPSLYHDRGRKCRQSTAPFLTGSRPIIPNLPFSCRPSTPAV